MTYVRNLDNDNLRQLATKALDDYVPVDDRLSAVMMLQDDMPRSILRLLDEIANRDDLLKRCQNHLFAGERRAWCWCADRLRNLPEGTEWTLPIKGREFSRTCFDCGTKAGEPHGQTDYGRCDGYDLTKQAGVLMFWRDLRDPGDHDPDCKWVADVDTVGGLRQEINEVLGR